MSVIDASTKDILFSQVTKKVSTAIGNWVQTLYPNIQRPSCPWCHTKGVELHRCHVGPRKIDIVRAEMDVLWKLSTAMGQMPNMDTFVHRVTERVKQDQDLHCGERVQDVWVVADVATEAAAPRWSHSPARPGVAAWSADCCVQARRTLFL